MPPGRYSRHVGGQARPDFEGRLLLGVRERYTFTESADDIYVLTESGDTPWAIAARAWPDIRIVPGTDPKRPEGFSPAELWWVILDILDVQDPLVPVDAGRRLRLPSTSRLKREVLE
jgi:hypothetical protein